MNESKLILLCDWRHFLPASFIEHNIILLIIIRYHHIIIFDIIKIITEEQHHLQTTSGWLVGCFHTVLVDDSSKGYNNETKKTRRWRPHRHRNGTLWTEETTTRISTASGAAYKLKLNHRRRHNHNNNHSNSNSNRMTSKNPNTQQQAKMKMQPCILQLYIPWESVRCGRQQV